MIVSFNPNMTVAKKNNSSQMVKNNPAAFKRNFTAKEIEGLVKKESSIVNNLLTFISAGVIRAQDGADKIAKNLLNQHPDNLGIKLVAAKFT